MAMEDDVFRHIGWLYAAGILETAYILAVELGMNRPDVNGVLVYEDKGEVK